MVKDFSKDGARSVSDKGARPISAKMKQTEIGLLPEDWEVVKIGHSFSFKNGLNKEKEFFGYGYPIVNYMDVFRNTSISKSDIKGKVFVSKQELKNFEVDKGDVLFTRTSETQEEIAYSAVITEKLHQTVFSGFVLRARPFNNLFSIEFCRYVFSNQIVREQIISNSTYTTRALTNGRVLSEIQIPLPPLPEQEAIAEALSDADTWIESLEKLIAKKRLIKQGAMQELLTPKADWEVKKLGEVIDVYRGGSPRPIQNYITDKLDGINWIKIGDTSSTGKYIVSTSERIIPDGEKNSRRVYPGDFLLSNSMSFGRPYILKIDGCIHDGWLVLQNYNASFDTEFLYYLLTSKYIIDQYKSKAAGSGVLNLNKEVVSTVELIIPSLTEQTRIATILSDMDAELEALTTQLAKAKQIKQGMMQELLTGRIRLV
jgi:type I restriction enzyme S subunit